MKQLHHYIQAGYPGIVLVSAEESRAELLLLRAAQELERNLFLWSCTGGLAQAYDAATQAPGGGEPDLTEPDAVLAAIAGLPPRSIIVLEDVHRFLKEPLATPQLIRAMKEALNACNKEVDGTAQAKTIVLLGCEAVIPPEIEKLLTVIDLPLPDREELKDLLQRFCESTGIESKGGRRKAEGGRLEDLILDAASGLTTPEAEDAFALSVIETGRLDPAVIQREKAGAVKKHGLLEIIDNKLTLDDIGGLDLLKEDLLANAKGFSKAARDYGLPTPTAKLFVGMGGTGKSLCASVMGRVHGVILLRLEAGKLFGSHVGDSERNWRTTFATARATGPCVLWIDEADGLFSAMRSGGTDGGTSLRVLKAIMQDMQFHAEKVLFCFTANDIDCFPDALIDRMDVWSVDLPTMKEREAIWRIQIARLRGSQVKPRDPGAFDVAAFAKATEGFSGRQIEQAWCKALALAYHDGDGAAEPTTGVVMGVLKSFVPTSKTMAVQIDARRTRLLGKAKPASAPETRTVTGGRKLAA